MTTNRFMPGIPTAPGPHRALVTNPEVSAAVAYHYAHPEQFEIDQAQEDLHSKQRIASALAPVALNDGGSERILDGRVGWNELCDNTNSWLEAHLAAVDFSDYDSTAFSSAEQERQNTLTAARQGVATIAAFLEASSKALAWRLDDDLESPNTDNAIWAANSRGFILHWLGLDRGMDYRLADALSERPCGDPFRVFKDLHFSWIYFKPDPATKEICLDEELVSTLSCNGTPITSVESGPLFGCPARRMVPRIYDLMVRKAAEADLFGQTYQEERVAYHQFWLGVDTNSGGNV